MNFKKRPRIMKNKLNMLFTFTILSFIVIATYAQTQVGVVSAQGAGGAYFTSLIVNNGLGFIDLINGGQAKVMLGQLVWCNLTFYNDKVGTLGVRLFTKLYVDGSLLGISSSQYIFRYLTGTQYWRLPDLSPGLHNVKVELWWDDGGTYYLEDARSFQVYVVQLTPTLSAPQVGVPRGSAKGSGWVVSLSNDGNDMMYRTTVSIVDSAGLVVYPQTASLEDLLPGAIKSTLFTLVAPSTLGTGQYNIKFAISYYDFVGNIHRDYFYGTVTVTRTPASLSVTLDQGVVIIGGTVTIQANLTSDGVGLGNQKIEFFVDENAIGYGTTDSSGRATIVYDANLTPGIHTIRAHFAGTGEFLASDGTANLVVVAIPTKIALTVPPSLTEGVGATLSAVLSDYKGSPIQGHTVEFFANGTVIGSTKTDSSGKATLEFVPRSSGSLLIQAVYEGAGNYAASSSQILTVQISPSIFGSTSVIMVSAVAALIVALASYLFFRKTKQKSSS